MKDKPIKGIECKFIVHRQATYNSITNEWTPDYHWIKERIHYEDGELEDNFKCVKDFKRPFWITSPFKRNHKDFKESELECNTNKYYATESELWREIGKKLGVKKHNLNNTKVIRKSPYIYGADVNSRVYIKQAYLDRYPECNSPYTIATLDIENDIDTDEITIISIAKEWEVYTVILKSFLNKATDYEKKLRKLFEDNIPVDFYIKNTYEVFETEIEMFKAIMDKAHEWGRDFLAIWNMDHELRYFEELCRKNECDIADFFSDPSVPKDLRFFKYYKKKDMKVSASGVTKGTDAKDKWNTVYCPSKFYVIDAMCAYNYNRVNSKLVPGGYGLDNILNHELGEKFKKLKFNYLNDKSLTGPDWHRFMVKHYPLEYIVYNQWDVLSMLVLENKTKDLKVALPVLCGVSPFDIYDSTPKRVVNSLLVKSLKKGIVLGCRLPMPDNYKEEDEEEEVLGLTDWIITLRNDHAAETATMRLIAEDPNTYTTIFTHVYDADLIA